MINEYECKLSKLVFHMQAFSKRLACKIRDVCSNSFIKVLGGSLLYLNLVSVLCVLHGSNSNETLLSAIRKFETIK